MSAVWQPSDLVFRQVHPNHLAPGGPNSVAFSPTPKDQDQLSVDDSRLVTAGAAWDHFTKNLGFTSAGTWAVSAGEIADTSDLRLSAAPVEGETDQAKNNPAHCVIDFSGVSTKGQKKRRAQELAIKASARGCQFAPPKR
jgi:hypothetical protein